MTEVWVIAHSWFNFQHCKNRTRWDNPHNPQIWEGETEGSKFLVHFGLHSKYENSKEYLR